MVIIPQTEREKTFHEIYEDLRKKEPFCNYRFWLDNWGWELPIVPPAIEEEFTKQLNELIPPDEDKMSIRENISRVL